MASTKSFANTPQAKDDAFTSAATGINENSATTFILNVMGNDSGGNSKSLYSLDNGVSAGGASPVDLLVADVVGVTESSALGAMISITADGKVAYVMTAALRTQLASLKAGQFATDTFTYAIQMGNGALSWATATVQIAGVNNAPVVTTAPGEATGTAAQGASTISGQLAISDVDGGEAPAWTVHGTPAGAFGVFSVDANGRWTYQLDSAASSFHALAEGETRTETFVVRVTDDLGATVDQAVTLTIVGSNDTPLVTNATTALAGSAADGGSGVASGQLSVSDVDHGATQTWSVQGNPVGAYGALAVDANGKWTYTLDSTSAAVRALAAGETRDETFTVRVRDDKGALVDQLVTVTVTGTNDAPVITNSVAAVTGSATDGAVGTVTGQLSASDADHGATQAWSVQGNPAGAYGALSVDANGKWTYTLDHAAAGVLAQGESFNEAFTVRVLDEHGAFVDQVITVTVNGTNDAPVITNAAAALVGSATDGGSVASGQLSASDVDHGATQTWSVQGNPVGAFGAMAVDANGKWTYTLDSASAAVRALAAGETRDETFTVRVRDDKGALVDQLVTVTVNGTNDAPVVTNTAAAVTGSLTDGAVSGQLSASDADHGATQAWSVQGNPAGTYGALSVDANGKWTYTLDHAAAGVLAQGESFNEAFTVRVLDDHGAFVDQLITVTVNGTNDAPVITNTATALAGSATDGAGGVASGQLSASDVDHGATQAWSVQGNPAGLYGALSVDAGGQWTYLLDPAAASALAQGETHDEHFTVRVMDDKGAWVDQGVTISVNGSNDAPVITSSPAAATGSASDATAVVTGRLTASDADHGATQAWSVQGNPAGAYGSLAIDANGQWTYALDSGAAAVRALAAGESHDEVFTVRITDDKGASVDHAITVTVTGSNDAPVITNAAAALAGAATAGENLVASGQLSAADVDHGATQAWSLVGDATNDYGSMSVDANGKWTFVMDGSAAATRALAANEPHAVSFVVRVADEHGASVDQTVTIMLAGANDAPVAASVAAALAGAVAEDGSLSASGQLAVTDVDHGATASWSVAGNPDGGYGRIAVDAAGQWHYQLDATSPAVQSLAAGESHDEVFAIRAIDDHGAAVDQFVTISVTGSNDAPVITNAAQAASATIVDGGAGSVSRQLLAVDADHGATQAWSVVGDAATPYGTMAVSDNGVWTYTPDSAAATVRALADGETQQQSFTLRVTDDQGAQRDQQVLVTLVGSNDAPLMTSGADAAHGVVREDTTLVTSGQLTAADADHGAILSWSLPVPAGVYGSVALDQGGRWTYTLNNSAQLVQALADGSAPAEHFTVRVTDQFGKAATQVLTIDVSGSNDAPLAFNDSIGATEDTAKVISAAALLANDTDADAGHVLSVTAVGSADHGTLSLANGIVSYLPAANYNGADSFTYTMQDDQGATSSAVVNLTVAAVNDAPVGVNDSATILEDTPYVVAASTLLANDTDVDAGDVKTISAVGNGAHGTATIVGGTVTYTPMLNYNGSDSFIYTVRDSAGLTSTASVNLTITPVNDAPVTQPFTLSTANTSLDVLVSGAWLYKSDGNDGFLAAIHPAGLPTSLYRFKVADMNADGFLDVVGDIGGLKVQTFLNNGSGVFSAAGVVTLPSATTQIEDIEVADFNGDHINDVVVSAGLGSHQVLLGGAGGSLTLKTGAIPTITPLTAANGVGVADIDADGDMDLTFASSGTFVSFMNNGAGVFTKGTTIGTTTANAYYADAFYADLDGSGKLDLVGVGGLDITYSYKDSASISNIIVTTANGTQTLPAAQSSDAAIGDINNDGFADIVISVARNYYSATPPAGQSDMIQLWLNDGHGHFVQATSSLTASVGGVPVSFTSVHLGDINGDGLLDLAATGYSSGIVTQNAPTSFAGPYIWINTGNGFTVAPTMSLSTALTAGTGYVNTQFGDLDGNASGSSEDSVQVFTATQLLAGAIDVEGDAVSIVSVNPLSANGARLTVVNGSIYYDPTASENLQALGGTDTVLDGFTYYVKDSNGATSSGIAKVVVRGIDAGDTVGNLLNNTLSGTAIKDTLIGLEGNDTLSGLDGNDILIGGDGSDVLNGGNGADLLVGGAGNDTMTGGAGADVFLYQGLGDRGATNDIITDFAKGAGGDVLQFTTMLRGFAGYDGSNAISGGYVQFVAAPNGSTMVQVDADGAAGPLAAVPLVILTGVVLGATDTLNFLL
jgi:VCBS repeat-containing protein